MKNMLFNKNSNEKRNILLKFVTSYSILLILILIMGLFLYEYGMRNAKQNLKSQNQTVLSNTVDNFENTLTLMSTLVTQFGNNSIIRSFLTYDSEGSADLSFQALDVMNVLTDFIPLESSLPISEYFIYLPDMDYVISASMFSDILRYYRHYKGFTASLYKDWHPMIQSVNNLKQFISLEDYYQGGFHSYLYKIPLSTSPLSDRASAIVCYEININKIQSLFSNLNMYETGFLIVTDTEGQELFRITDQTTKESSITLFMNQLDRIPPEAMNHQKNIKLNRESYNVTFVSSSDTMYHYYLVQPSELVFHDLNAYQNAYGIIIVLTCVFCLLVIYLLSKRNVRPIIKIHSDLQTSIHRANSLMEELEDQKPLIRHSYIGKMIRGQIYSEEEARKIQDYLGLTEPNMKYSILFASIYENQIEFYQNQDNEWEPETDTTNDYQEIIHSYINEYFGNQTLIYDVGVNSFAVLISSADSASPEDINIQMKELFSQMHNALVKERGIWVFGGLGNRNAHITYLWKSYQQACQAISYLHEGNVFMSFHDIKRDKSSYYYPFEMAQQLSNFIQVGNQKQVNEIFRLIKKENYIDVSLPLQLEKWLLSDIRNTLLKVRFSITNYEDNSIILDWIDAAFLQNKTIDLMEDISLKLCCINQNKAEGNRLILKIKEYIKDNYKDSSLSLKKISEVFDISESYFSYLFKAETKQNFSEYLELIRMNQAMVLLKTTDINITSMYLELGYNNTNSFRRAFKKIHGVSPKAIRESLSLDIATEIVDVNE